MTADMDNSQDRVLPEQFVESFDNFCVGLVDLKHMRATIANLLDQEPEARDALLRMIDFAFREGLIRASTFEVLTTDIDRATSEDEATEWSEQTLEKLTDEFDEQDVPVADETNPPEQADEADAAEIILEQITTGTVLNDRFELGERIGGGSMADVFAAVDRRKVEAGVSDPRLAVKVISKAFSRHAKALETLQREALSGQSLTHPNIVRIFDCDRDGNRFYLTMELLEGESLARIMDQHGFRPLPFNQGLSILRGVCRGLQHAHEQGIVHADIKPGNIFICAGDQPKLLDFGIARITRRDDQASNAPVVGAHTPGFSSCEVLEGHEPNEQDDLYALACVAYRMLAGKRPFGRSTALEAERKQLEPEPIATLNKQQWHTLRTALAFRREDRTASVAEFVAGLFAAHQAPAPVAEPAPPAFVESAVGSAPFTMPKRLPARLPLRYALPGAAAALFVIALFAFRSDPAPESLPVAEFTPPAPRVTMPTAVIKRPEPQQVAEPVIAELPAEDEEPVAATDMSADEPEFVAAPPELVITAELDKEEFERATELIALTDAALTDGRLLDPEDDNASGYISELEALEPESDAVRQRKSRLIDLMLIEAMVSITDQDFTGAERWITETRNLGAAEDSLARFETELQKARDAAEARNKESLAIFASATPAAVLANPDIPFNSSAGTAAPAAAETSAAGQMADSTELVGGSFALAMTPGALPMVETPAIDTPPPQPEPAVNNDIALSALEFKRFVEPEIPRRSSMRKSSGWVELRFKVGTNGRTDDLEVIASSPDDRFDKLAVEAVSKWRFKPVYVDGVATEKYSSVRLKFSPQ